AYALGPGLAARAAAGGLLGPGVGTCRGRSGSSARSDEFREAQRATAFRVRVLEGRRDPNVPTRVIPFDVRCCTRRNGCGCLPSVGYNGRTRWLQGPLAEPASRGLIWTTAT